MSRLRAIPSGWWLGAIVVLGSVVWSVEALRLDNWVVQTDELQYVRIAMGMADTLSPVPTIHGENYGSFSPLFPLLIAPFYGLFEPRTAFDLAHVAGAVAMSSAAIPAYLLTRELTPSRLAALLAAGLTVSVAWFSLVTMLRTELVAYPAFLWAVLALQRAVAEPSTGRDLLALAALAVAALSRTQLLALAPVFPLAIVLHETGRTLVEPPAGRSRAAAVRDALWRSVTGHPLVAAVTAVGAVLVVTGVAADALGRYETVGRGELLPDGVWDQGRWQLAIVVIASGCVPFILAFGWVLETLVRPATRGAHAYAIVALLAAAAVVLQASGFVVQFVPGENYQDRYFFYVAPLLMVGMVAWLTDRRRLWLGAAAGAVVFVWIASRHHFDPFGVFSYSPVSAFNPVWAGRAGELSDVIGTEVSVRDAVRWGGLVLGLGVAIGARLVPRTAALVAVSGAVIVFGAVQGGYIVNKILPTQAHGIGVTTRDWVDDARTDDGRVGMVPSASAPPWNPTHVVTNAAPWWNVEFWNSSVDRLYSHGVLFGPFPSRPLIVDEDTGELSSTEALRPYLVSGQRRVDLHLRGRVLASAPPLELVRLERPYAADWAVSGLTRGDSILRSRQATLTAYPRRGAAPEGRRFRFTLRAPPVLGEPQRYSLRGGGNAVSGRIPRGGTVVRALSVCVRSAPVRIRIRSGRAYMALPVGQIGLQLAAVVSRPDPAACR